MWPTRFILNDYLKKKKKKERNWNFVFTIRVAGHGDDKRNSVKNRVQSIIFYICVCVCVSISYFLSRVIVS